MALKDLIVIVDDSPAAATRIDVAVTLASRHDAHLTGLYIRAPFTMPRYVEAELPEAVRALQRRREDEAAAHAHALFDERVRRGGLTDRSEWRTAAGHPTETAAVHGRYADLIIAGQLDPRRDSDHMEVMPQDLLFEAGRPVLVVPFAGRFDTVGERILVGWNASREAARAVNDAMALLTAARRVTVLAVNPRPGRQGTGLGDEPAADVTRHLARHGVRAEAAHVRADSVDPGTAFLNHITDSGSDLVVMGAYGRSRFREMVLGGMTHFILHHMTVPVLMTH